MNRKQKLFCFSSFLSGERSNTPPLLLFWSVKKRDFPSSALSNVSTYYGLTVSWFHIIFVAPSRAPSVVTPTVTGASSVTLKWGPVPAVGQNGQILGYKVSCMSNISLDHSFPSPFFHFYHFLLLSLHVSLNNSIGNACYAGYPYRRFRYAHQDIDDALA